MLQGLKICVVVAALVALFALTQGDLTNIRGLTTDTSYFTVQLAEATRLEKEMLRFRTDAQALVDGDPAVTSDDLKLSFDLLWSRVDTESTRATDPRLTTLRKFRPELAKLMSGLQAIDQTVQSLHAGDMVGLNTIQSVMHDNELAMSEMNKAAYEELYQTSADTAVNQRFALKSLDRLQMMILVVGFAALIMLLLQLRKSEKLNAELKGREEEIRQLASVDALTNLRNRRYFDERMKAIDDGTWKGAHQALLIDLDGFKAVNDSYGHAVGDYVLRTVSRIITTACGEGKLVARLGGDEFAVVFNGTAQEACRLARSIIREVARPMAYDGKILHVGASIGLSRAEANSRDSELMLKQADMALYEAKTHGRGRVSCVCHERGEACPALLDTVIALRA